MNTNNHKLKKSIKDSVLEKIKTGQAQMKPRWHFVLKTALLAVGTILVVLILLYLASFIMFTMRQTGVWFAPSFGWRGLFIFLASLPWLLIILSLVFIVILEVLTKRYSFAYRKPLLYSVLGVVAVVLIGSFVIAQTGFHRGFFRHAQENRLPIAGPLYRELGMKRLEHVHPGAIAEITDSGFIIKTQRGEKLAVIITPQTRFPLGIDLAVDDEVLVLGERDNGAVTAFGIRRIEDGLMMLRRRDNGAMMPPVNFDKSRNMKPHFFRFRQPF